MYPSSAAVAIVHAPPKVLDVLVVFSKIMDFNIADVLIELTTPLVVVVIKSESRVDDELSVSFEDDSSCLC